MGPAVEMGVLHNTPATPSRIRPLALELDVGIIIDRLGDTHAQSSPKMSPQGRSRPSVRRARRRVLPLSSSLLLQVRAGRGAGRLLRSLSFLGCAELSLWVTRGAARGMGRRKKAARARWVQRCAARTRDVDVPWDGGGRMG